MNDQIEYKTAKKIKSRKRKRLCEWKSAAWELIVLKYLTNSKDTREAMKIG